MILQPTLTGEYVNLFLGGVAGLVLLSVALIAFFVVYQRRIFAQERLRELERTKHQQELLIAAVEIQETERRRIARDLHDDIGSLLTATRLYLRQLTPDGDARKIASIREQSLSILDEMIQNARRITHDLLPPTLEKFGFQAAAEDLCERVNQSGALSLRYSNATNDDLRLFESVEVGLYRILQELLTNTMKHAEAEHITVQLEKGPNNFIFTYTDDGKGFSRTDGRREGLGIRNIESRISVIGGTIEANSAPGVGVKFVIEVPLLTRPST